MNLQPLYDVKERLECAAIAGTGLLGEDFRLQRAAEQLKPLGAASPVFGKISAGLDKLLSAPAGERAGVLLDLLALADAVVYTQGRTGLEGELPPLSTGAGSCRDVSYCQLQPLLTALTTTGGGRMEIVQSTWENHPEFFSDFRVLPAVVAGLGDSYIEVAELNAKILRGLGPAALPILKEGFDPAGKKEMARRVEVISAIEGANANPWLLELLPAAKKEVRPAVLAALGEDPDNAGLLLELSKTERGKNRDAVLRALARQDGEAVQAFWAAETGKKPEQVSFLAASRTDWASDLAAAAFRSLLEEALPADGRLVLITSQGVSAFRSCRAAILGKTSPAMLDCWRWVDQHFDLLKTLKSDTSLRFRLGEELENWLLLSLCCGGPGPLAELCLEMWEKHRDQPQYLPHALLAMLLTRPAAQVFDTFSPYILTEQPESGLEEGLQKALMQGLGQVLWDESVNKYQLRSFDLAEPLDPRWIKRLTCAVCPGNMENYFPFGGGDGVSEFDWTLMRLVNPEDPEHRACLIPYLRRRMGETGSWYSYSHWLLRCGGSPRGMLGTAMRRRKKSYLYHLWQMLSKGADTLPAEELAGLCQEALEADCMRTEDRELARKVIPWTIEQLQADKPFPEWSVWWNMR